MEDPRIKLNGSTAWVSGIEKVQLKSKAGEAGTGANLGTSIFVKQDGRWRMVYHHASAMPKLAPTSAAAALARTFAFEQLDPGAPDAP
jgi:hypothetical protein